MKEDFPEYWKTIVDTMMDGVVVVDRAGIIVSVNKALERMTGYDSSELVGRECVILDCDACVFPAGKGKNEKKCHLFTAGSVVRHRCQFKRKDGRPLYVLKNGAVLRNADGAVAGAVETLTDIGDLVAKERTIRELKDLLAPEDGFAGIIGRSSKMLDVFALIRNAAASDAPIVIYGESGTGKELVAREIHNCSPRSDGPFIAINSAALPETLIESELFGHEKGAFTGAMERSAGCFEQAHGGTLFLDEIGEMPQSTQPKLLRVLEDLRVRRLGGTREIAVDARVLAATSQEIGSHLREELYYRLSVFQIVLPPLRERKEDIPLIADVMLQNLNKKHGTRVTGVDAEVLSVLYRYDWPGNVRELRNVLERAAIMAGEGLIHLTNLAGPALGLSPGPYGRHSSGHAGAGMLQPGHSLTQLEESYIRLTLDHVHGNRKLAAELLGISLRTLQNRIAVLREEAKEAAACDGANNAHC